MEGPNVEQFDGIRDKLKAVLLEAGMPEDLSEEILDEIREDIKAKR